MSNYDLDQLTSVIGPRRAQEVIDNRTDYDEIPETAEQYILRALGLG